MEGEKEPTITFTVGQDGVIITQRINEVSVMQTVISEQNMNLLCKGWIDSRREVKKMLDLTQRIREKVA